VRIRSVNLMFAVNCYTSHCVMTAMLLRTAPKDFTHFSTCVNGCVKIKGFDLILLY